MEIREVSRDKKAYMDLLLLADEQEDMIDRYLDRGTMFILDDDGVKAECVVTDEGSGVLELKNIAVAPQSQRRGYGRQLIQSIEERYRDQFHTFQVGTGASPLTMLFYQNCGFVESHRIPGFFTAHYDHPIFECGTQLVDMVYLRKRLVRRDAKPEA